jgi:hypothetical protein
LPGDQKYAPGYFSNNQETQNSWGIVNPIFIEGDTDIHDMISILPFAWQVYGNGEVKGKIIKEDFSEPGSQKTLPVQGALVYLMNSKGGICKYSMTDQNGEFEIRVPDENLERYYLQIEKIGFAPYIIDLSQIDNNLFEAKLTHGILISVQDAKNSEDKLQLYPLPCNEVLNVSCPKDFSIAKFEIFDLSGNSVLSASAAHISASVLTINTGGLGAGGYYLHMTAKNGDLLKSKFIISR